jgi:hypothetical protein
VNLYGILMLLHCLYRVLNRIILLGKQKAREVLLSSTQVQRILSAWFCGMTRPVNPNRKGEASIHGKTPA